MMNKEDSERFLEKTQSLQLNVLLSNIFIGLAAASFIGSFVLIVMENAFVFLLMPLAMLFIIVSLVFRSCETRVFWSIQSEFIIPHDHDIKAKNNHNKKKISQ